MAATPGDADDPPPILQADEEAKELSELMLDSQEVMETVLSETVESAEDGEIRESGRTVCGAGVDIRPPLQRFEGAVELAACPRSATGIWHTHPTQFGLAEPVHSLPDWANVVFHDVDASVVVGTQSSEVVVSATNQQAMEDAFRNALGTEVSDTRDVVDAIKTGRINSPTAARQRVRSELSPLVRRVPTPFPEMGARATKLSIPAADAIHACGTVEEVNREQETEQEHTRARDEVAHPDLAADDGRRSMALHRRACDCTPAMATATEGINIRELTIATVIGNLVGGVTNALIFG